MQMWKRMDWLGVFVFFIIIQNSTGYPNTTIFTTLPTWQWYFELPTAYTYIPNSQFVDVNGDGLVDITSGTYNVAYAPNYKELGVYLNNGCTWVNSSQPFNYCPQFYSTSLGMNVIPDIISKQEAAFMLGTDEEIIDEMVKNKKIYPVDIGGTERFSKTALRRWFERQADPDHFGSPIMTIEQAAQYIQVSTKSIETLILEGNIKSRKVDGEWRIHKKSLDNLFS